MIQIINRAREHENHILIPALPLFLHEILGVALSLLHLLKILIPVHCCSGAIMGAKGKSLCNSSLGLEWRVGELVGLCALRLEPGPCVQAEELDQSLKYLHVLFFLITSLIS